MKVLVICQYYWPEPFITSDICEGLVARGHEITLITGLPNYGMPNGEIPSEYANEAYSETIRNGVRVIRLPLAPRKSGSINRIKNYLTFWRNANDFIKHFDEDHDVVLGLQFSPVMQVDSGIVYAKKHGKKMLLYCYDLWPVSLLAGGLKESSIPFKWMRHISKRIYSQADRIAVTSPLFDEYFRGELGLTIPNSTYLPQYADDSFLKSADPVREGFDPSKVNLTFAGNVGVTQSVETLVEAAALLKDDPRIAFHVVGSGSRLEACEKLARERGAANVVFHGRKPPEDMPAYYAASDAMVVTLDDSPMARYTLPRKVTTYLAAGKPVLAALSGEASRVVEAADCGLSCPTGDAEGLARIAGGLASSNRIREWGHNARVYYEEHFTKERFFDTLESLLEELAEER